MSPGVKKAIIFGGIGVAVIVIALVALFAFIIPSLNKVDISKYLETKINTSDSTIYDGEISGKVSVSTDRLYIDKLGDAETKKLLDNKNSITDYKDLIDSASKAVDSSTKRSALADITYDLELECKIKDAKEETTEDSESAMEIPTVLPSRTFLEKAFLLNEEFQRAKPRSLRMSRHLYDLEKLMDTPFAKDALQNKELYLSIIAHRKQFYHVGGVNYEKNLPQSIDFIPYGELDTQYRSDYEDMLATYIYDRTNAPTYEELIQRIQILIERFRNCNWNI